MVREIPLSEVGLETVEQAAARRGQAPATVRRLVAVGQIPAVIVGSGRSARYLVRPADVDAVPVRGAGALPGNQSAKKKPGEEAAGPPAAKKKARPSKKK